MCNYYYYSMIRTALYIFICEFRGDTQLLMCKRTWVQILMLYIIFIIGILYIYVRSVRLARMHYIDQKGQ